MAEVLLFVVQLALGIALPALVVRFDMRRLDEARLDRTWNDASFWSAVVGFGPFCLPVHFLKSRRNGWGVLRLGMGYVW